MSQADLEAVYRQALKLPPDKRRQLVEYLTHPPALLPVDEIMARFEANADALRALGVARIGVFGLVVRGESDAASDIDVLVHMAEDAYSLLTVSRIGAYLEDLLGRPVDVVTEDALRPELRESVLDEVIYAEGV